MARLRQRGFEPREASVAAGQADIVVLALPDIVLAQIAKEIVPLMQSGAMLVCLDPAASHGEEFPRREVYILKRIRSRSVLQTSLQGNPDHVSSIGMCMNHTAQIKIWAAPQRIADIHPQNSETVWSENTCGTQD